MTDRGYFIELKLIKSFCQTPVRPESSAIISSSPHVSSRLRIPSSVNFKYQRSNDKSTKPQPLELWFRNFLTPPLPLKGREMTMNSLCDLPFGMLTFDIHLRPVI